MNWDQVEGNWKQHKGKIMSRWGKLSDDDIETINGKRSELIGLLQKHYGRGTEQAENEIDQWIKKLN